MASENLGQAYITVMPKMEGTARAIESQLGAIDSAGIGKGLGGKLGGGLLESVKSVAIGNVLASGITAAADAAKGFASGVVQAGADFDAAMSSVQALSGATAEDMARLESTAKEFGGSTKFSATEAADALGYMALAGWDTDQSIAGLPGILDMAAASNMDLAAASDMVTDYLTAFGMAASQSGEMADMMAYAQAHSNTTTQALGEAFKNCAPNMSAAGQSMQTTTALLSKMANQGLKGSEAGTALTATMRDLTSKMEDGCVAIGDTSVAVMDSEGNYRNLIDIIADVDDATAGMGDAQKAAALSATFTADSIRGMNMLLQGGVGDLYSFNDALGASAGSASQMAATMQDNLQGALTTCGSAFEGLQLAIFDGVEPALSGIVNSVASGVLPALTALVQGADGAGAQLTEAATQAIAGIAAMVSEQGPGLVDMVVQVVQSLVEAVIANLPAFLEAGLQLFVQLALAVAEALPQIVEALMGVLPSLLETLVAMMPDLLAAGIQLFLALVESIGQALPQIVTALIGCVPTLCSSLISMGPQLLGAGLQFFITLVSSVAQALPQILAALVDLGFKMVGKIPEFAGQMVDAGFNLLMGLAQGIGNAVSSVIASVVDACGQILSSVLGFFGINSPSRVFAEVGEYDMKGLAAGFEGAARATSRSIAGTMGRVMGEVQGSMDPLSVGVDAVVGSKVDAVGRVGAAGSQDCRPTPLTKYEITIDGAAVAADPRLEEALGIIAGAAERRRAQGRAVRAYA